MQNSAGIVDFPPSHACMVEVSQIHSSPTPTHHPANPVNSENFKYPTREKMRNPATGSDGHLGGLSAVRQRLASQHTDTTVLFVIRVLQGVGQVTTTEHRAEGHLAAWATSQ